MTQQHTELSQAEIEQIAQQLNDWAHTLAPRQEAMLVDLLAKAGGDVFGHDAANSISADDADVSSSQLSPLEMRDYRQAIIGIFSSQATA